MIYQKILFVVVSPLSGHEEGEFIRLRDVLIVATFIWLISYYIHSPLAGGGTWIYSDIVGLLSARGLLWADRLLIPYADYHFEYPPLVALLFILSNLVMLLIPKENMHMRAFVGYTVMSIVLYLHAIGTIIVLHKLAGYTRRRSIHILIYYVLMPSFLIYTNYNWDIMGIFYALLGLYLFLRNKRLLSALMFGLAAAGKIIPAVVALGPATQLFVEKLKEMRDKGGEVNPIMIYIRAIVYPISYLLVVVGEFLAWNIPFMIISFDGWYSGMIAHHAGWYIEDSWLILIFDPADPLAKYASASVMVFLMLISAHLLVIANISGEERVIVGGTLYMAVFLFSTYVYTPQMNLLILPLFTLVPLGYTIVFVFDALNAMIILSWFNFQNIYRLFEIETEGPLDRTSIPQIAAWTRCSILLMIIIKIWWSLYSSSIKTTENVG